MKNSTLRHWLSEARLIGKSERIDVRPVSEKRAHVHADGGKQFCVNFDTVKGFTICERYALTPHQKAIYDPISSLLLGRIAMMLESGQSGQVMLRMKDHPEVFTLRYERPNVAGNVIEAMLPVWFRLDDDARDHDILLTIRLTKDGTLDWSVVGIRR